MMTRKQGLNLQGVAAIALIVAIASAPALGNVITVGPPPCGPGGTISNAVISVTSGGTVIVCPGTYPEQVVITKPLTLKGKVSGTMGAAVIVSPSGGVVANTTSLATGSPIAAQVLVSETTGLGNVNISDITVDGANNLISSCGPPTLVGIMYQNSSGTVSSVATRNQTLSVSLNGCQNGLGIFVQSGTVASGPTTSVVTVSGSTVHDYQKNGITGNEVGTTITVKSNTVRGQGPTTGAAENGIQLGFGAVGSVTSNSVIDDIFAPDTITDPGDAAAGILLFDAAHVPVNHNSVGNTQFAIGTSEDAATLADGANITANTIWGTQIFDGIDLCSNGNTASKNTINSSAESGVHLDSSCTSTGNNNTVQSNSINEACAGILEGSGTSGNTISLNTFNNTVSTDLSGDVCPAMTMALVRVGGESKHRQPRAARP